MAGPHLPVVRVLQARARSIVHTCSQMCAPVCLLVEGLHQVGRRSVASLLDESGARLLVWMIGVHLESGARVVLLVCCRLVSRLAGVLVANKGLLLASGVRIQARVVLLLLLEVLLLLVGGPILLVQVGGHLLLALLVVLVDKRICARRLRLAAHVAIGRLLLLGHGRMSLLEVLLVAGVVRPTVEGGLLLLVRVAVGRGGSGARLGGKVVGVAVGPGGVVVVEEALFVHGRGGHARPGGALGLPES